MYSTLLKFSSKENINHGDVCETLHNLLALYYKNGQIIGSEWHITSKNHVFEVIIYIPEKESLASRYDNKYIKQAWENMGSLGIVLEKTKLRGEDVDSYDCGCLEQNDWLILYTHQDMLESPVWGGDDFLPIPLYHLPKTYDAEYFDIKHWESDYQNCDELQMGCFVGERFALRQMFDINSSLSRDGLAICDKLTSLSGKKCFYYLHKYYGKSLEKEKARVCPKCGNAKWLLKEPLHDIFDFKCDNCLLLSSIAFQIR